MLTWLAAGKSKPDIATILNKSEATVDTHVRRIFRKLDSNNRVMAISKALSFGLIRP